MQEKQDAVYVIGHRNPDTDSICSAIGYAHLKQVLGEPAIPARAGKINAETKFVLEYFQVEAPELLADLYPRVKDIMSSGIVSVSPNDTLHDLGRIMKKNGIKSVPVLGDKRQLAGIVTVGDLAQLYFDELEMQDLSLAGVDFAGLLRALDGTLLCGEDLQRKVTGKVRIAAGSSRTIWQKIHPGDVVLVSDRPDAQFACIQRAISCMILTGNDQFDPELQAEAERQGVIVMTAPYDTYTCARLINQSIPVESVMKEKVIALKPTDLVSDVKNIVARDNYRLYPVVENEKLVGAVYRDKLYMQERVKVILVDHNERSQAIEGIEEAQIMEIIDHHRLGGLQTGEPIFIRHDPVGCTATIVAHMHWHRGFDLPKPIAGLLLAAIVSDTALFKSPTCTARDRDTAEKLAVLAGLDLAAFGLEVLKAGSSLKGMSVADIIRSDVKEFVIGEYRVAVAQISIMDAQEALTIRQQLQADMEDMRRKEDYDMVLLMVTDIMAEGTHLFYTGQPDILVQKAFGISGADGGLYLPGVLSRKKQVIPPLIEAAKKQ
ncbi:MAG: putative signal transduction protein with domain containing protein [Firmicutes bacterium]|nr:putative signal transduction protein with domain containing protein [Bacillota bacterium]